MRDSTCVYPYLCAGVSVVSIGMTLPGFQTFQQLFFHNFFDIDFWPSDHPATVGEMADEGGGKRARISTEYVRCVVRSPVETYVSITTPVSLIRNNINIHLLRP